MREYLLNGVLMVAGLVAIACVVAINPARSQSVSGGQPAQTLPQKLAAGALPACNAAAEGTVIMVTDALLPVALALVVGGGAVHVMVTCNGSIWVVL